MQEPLPTDAISLLEEKNHFSGVKTVFAAVAILVVTFAIPATITQFYRVNLIQSGAEAPTPTPQSFILGASETPAVTQTPTPTLIVSPVANTQTVINGKESYSILDFIQLNIWVIPLGCLLMASWLGLVFMYLWERKNSQKSLGA